MVKILLLCIVALLLIVCIIALLIILKVTSYMIWCFRNDDSEFIPMEKMKQ